MSAFDYNSIFIFTHDTDTLAGIRDLRYTLHRIIPVVTDAKIEVVPVRDLGKAIDGIPWLATQQHQGP